MELFRLSALELADKMEKGECTSEEIVLSYFSRIDEVEASVGSYVTLCKEAAINKAKLIDEKRKNGEKLDRRASCRERVYVLV